MTQEETKTKNEKVNVGYLSNKQLKDKLDNIETKSVPNAKKKKNINGKVGINKKNNYTLEMYAPRKVCSKCGSVNHLAMHCKVVVPPMISPSMPTLVDQNFNGLAQIPFLPNPYYQYENTNMFTMPWSTPTVTNSFSYLYPENASKRYSRPRNSV